MALVRSKKIKDAARDQDCTMRLPGVCNWNAQTCVMAHIGKNRGMGIKCNDTFVVIACSACHDEIDGRTRKIDRQELESDKLRALEETQQILIDLGLMAVK